MLRDNVLRSCHVLLIVVAASIQHSSAVSLPLLPDSALKQSELRSETSTGFKNGNNQLSSHGSPSQDDVEAKEGLDQIIQMMKAKIKERNPRMNSEERRKVLERAMSVIGETPPVLVYETRSKMRPQLEQFSGNNKNDPSKGNQGNEETASDEDMMSVLTTTKAGIEIVQDSVAKEQTKLLPNGRSLIHTLPQNASAVNLTGEMVFPDEENSVDDNINTSATSMEPFSDEHDIDPRKRALDGSDGKEDVTSTKFVRPEPTPSSLYSAFTEVIYAQDPISPDDSNPSLNKFNKMQVEQSNMTTDSLELYGDEAGTISSGHREDLGERNSTGLKPSAERSSSTKRHKNRRHRSRGRKARNRTTLQSQKEYHKHTAALKHESLGKEDNNEALRTPYMLPPGRTYDDYYDDEYDDYNYDYLYDNDYINYGSGTNPVLISGDTETKDESAHGDETTTENSKMKRNTSPLVSSSSATRTESTTQSFTPTTQVSINPKNEATPETEHPLEGPASPPTSEHDANRPQDIEGSGESITISGEEISESKVISAAADENDIDRFHQDELMDASTEGSGIFSKPFVHEKSDKDTATAVTASSKDPGSIQLASTEEEIEQDFPNNKTKLPVTSQSLGHNAGNTTFSNDEHPAVLLTELNKVQPSLRDYVIDKLGEKFFIMARTLNKSNLTNPYPDIRDIVVKTLSSFRVEVISTLTKRSILHDTNSSLHDLHFLVNGIKFHLQVPRQPDFIQASNTEVKDVIINRKRMYVSLQLEFTNVTVPLHFNVEANLFPPFFSIHKTDGAAEISIDHISIPLRIPYQLYFQKRKDLDGEDTALGILVPDDFVLHGASMMGVSTRILGCTDKDFMQNRVLRFEEYLKNTLELWLSGEPLASLSASLRQQLLKKARQTASLTLQHTISD